MTRLLIALCCVAGLIAGLGSRWLVRELTSDSDPKLAIFVADAPAKPMSVEAELRACRGLAAGRTLSEDARREISRICAGAAGMRPADAREARLVACLLAIRELGPVDGCGLKELDP